MVGEENIATTDKIISPHGLDGIDYAFEQDEGVQEIYFNDKI
jgi:hypothetical protein